MENTTLTPFMTKMKSRRKKGLLLTFGPFVLIFVVIVSWSILSVIAANLGGSAQVGIRLMNVVLGFLGIIGIMGCIFGFPIGIILIIMSYEKEPQNPPQQTPPPNTQS